MSGVERVFHISRGFRVGKERVRCFFRYDVVGFGGGCVLAVALVPQIYKAIKSRKCSLVVALNAAALVILGGDAGRTQDLSFGWQSIYITGLSCYIVYSTHYGLWPLYIPAS